MAIKEVRQRLFIALLVLGLGIPTNVMGVMVGKLAPDFTLPSTNGKDITLSEFRGDKMVLIEFYAINFGAT